MTREEQIRQASIEYTMVNAPKCIGGDAFSEVMDGINRNHAFEEGAKWAYEQFSMIWHDVKEVPSKYKAIICLCYVSPLNKNLIAETVTAEQLFNRIDDWHDINKYMRTVKWAYVDDIVKFSLK